MDSFAGQLLLNHGYRSLSTASSSSTTQGTLWVRELRSICEELELNWSFLLRILLSHFSHVSFKGVINKQALHLPRPPRCRYRTSNSCSLFFEFRVNFMLCSSVVRLKRMGNWIEIVISLLVLSLTFQFKANDCVCTHFVYLFTC